MTSPFFDPREYDPDDERALDWSDVDPIEDDRRGYEDDESMMTFYGEV